MTFRSVPLSCLFRWPRAWLLCSALPLIRYRPCSHRAPGTGPSLLPTPPLFVPPIACTFSPLSLCRSTRARVLRVGPHATSLYSASVCARMQVSSRTSRDLECRRGVATGPSRVPGRRHLVHSVSPVTCSAANVIWLANQQRVGLSVLGKVARSSCAPRSFLSTARIVCGTEV